MLKKIILQEIKRRANDHFLYYRNFISIKVFVHYKLLFAIVYARGIKKFFLYWVIKFKMLGK